ncbi:MAG: amino acid ABC transporter permease [Sporolactobacillus sp.]
MNIKFTLESLPQVASVLPVTLFIAIVATFVGFLLAIGIAIARERKIKVLAQVLGVLVSFIRGTPMIVQLYVVYYGLPQLLMYLANLGLDVQPQSLPHMIIAVSAYALNAAANLSETIRSAYRSVDYGQYEAAISVGMTPTRAMRQIIIPQLIVNLVPNFSNFFLDLIKDTSLVYNIGIVEIMAKANIIASLGFQYLETYLDALFVYLVICFVFGKLLQVVEVLLRKHVFSNSLKTA